MSEMIILLLHGGESHTASKIILDYLKGKTITGLSLIYIGSDTTKNRIMNNVYNAKVESLPSIVIKMNDNPPQIYKADLETIKKLTRKLRNI